MHKRNITATALALAAVITVAFVLFPRLNHSDALGLLYFPSILLSVIFSGGSHSPPAVAGWSSFVVYTLFYWIVFLVLYALLWEIYLFRQVLHHLDDAKQHLISGAPHSEEALEKIGRAIAEVETRRRKHFLLKKSNSIDLSEPPHLLAARAMIQAGQEPPVKRVLKRFKSRLVAEAGPLKAAALMAKLEEDANTLASHSANRKPGTSGDSGPSEQTPGGT